STARRPRPDPAHRAPGRGAEPRQANQRLRPAVACRKGVRGTGSRAHGQAEGARAHCASRGNSLMARTGLGRGLDVLLGQAPASATTSSTAPPVGTTEIALERIRPNPQQPRTNFEADGIAELASSIKRHGVLQPIVVSRDADGFELVAGHRRVIAARLAGKTTIPAVIRDDVRDRLELALVENLQRADLNAIETARAYKLLMETYDLTQEQVADRVGKSRSQVANMLRTLTAPQPLQDAVMEGKISEGHLR